MHMHALIMIYTIITYNKNVITKSIIKTTMNFF
jgi:hypothetical protein